MDRKQGAAAAVSVMILGVASFACASALELLPGEGESASFAAVEPVAVAVDAMLPATVPATVPVLPVPVPTDAPTTAPSTVPPVPATITIVRTRWVDDVVVVPSATTAPAPAPTAPPTPEPISSSTAPPPSTATASTAPSPTAPSPTAAAPSSSSSTSSSSTSSSAPSTSRPGTRSEASERPSGTTLPRGVEVPEDWPADRPLPPIPAGCKEPHLEDDGEWNCG